MSERARMLLDSPSRRLTEHGRVGLALVLAGMCVMLASQARADEFELPPDPRDRPPSWNVEPRLELVFPLVTRRLCPNDGECIYGSGFGLGALAERRYRSGVGLGVVYDLRFMAGGNVFELSTLQTFGVSFRYVFKLRSAAHPFLGLEGGAALFGDTFQVATGGWYVDGRAGVEIEATDTLSFTLYAILRSLYTAPFTSARDDVRRSSSGGLDLTLSVGGGLALRFGP